jgi:hypothetical protein
MMKNLVFILILVTNFTLKSQEKLPYSEIPVAANEYTPGTTASRLIDGLGFRYYWATDGLKEKDLVFKPNSAARSSEETIDHILGLSQVILNATLKVKNGQKKSEMTFAEKRKKTLDNLHQASKILRASKDISQYKMIFGKKELPFWNVINGPIADAIWHVGQVVSFRRSSGNPINPKIDHLSGRIKE